MTESKTPIAGATGALSSREMRMLASIRHGLQNTVSTEVSSELAKTYCGFSVEYIDKLLIRHTEWPAILRQQLRRQTEVLRQACELLDGGAEARANGEATLRVLKDQPDETLEQLEQSQRTVDTALEQVIPSLFDARTSDTVESLNRLLREQISSVRDSEQAFNAALKGRVERHNGITSKVITVTRDTLQNYLREHFPERPTIEITSFFEVPGGSSKSTILVDVRGFEHTGITPLVFRLDRIAGSTDTRVLDEVPTLKAMFAQGLPVPEVLWVEQDASKIGLAFLVVRKIDAALGGGMWHADPLLCNADTVRDLAGILAKLHALDAAGLGMRGALNSDPEVHPMRGLIDNIRGLWSERKLEPDGTLETCLCWLETHMPPAPAKLSLIHADVSFHNIMVKDKKVACLLDWELSHLGDPIEDLSYARPCIEQLIPWDEFLTEYRRQGGGEYSEETGRYYGIWRGVRNAVYTLTSQHSFHTDANPDMRWGFFATYYRMVLLEAADKVAEAGVQAHQ